VASFSDTAFSSSAFDTGAFDFGTVLVAAAILLLGAAHDLAGELTARELLGSLLATNRIADLTATVTE
jgi:hypothetical protein